MWSSLVNCHEPCISFNCIQVFGKQLCSLTLQQSPSLDALRSFFAQKTETQQHTAREKRTCSFWISELIAFWIHIWHSAYTLYCTNIYLSLFIPCDCSVENGITMQEIACMYGSHHKTIAKELLYVNKKCGRLTTKRERTKRMHTELEQIAFSWIKLASSKYWQQRTCECLSRKWNRSRNKYRMKKTWFKCEKKVWCFFS